MFKNLLIGFAVLMVLGGIVGGKKSAPTDAVKSNANVSVPVARFQLKLNQFGCTREYGYTTVTGTVTNISDQPIDSLMVLAAHYQSSSGKLIKTSTAMVEFQPLMPGQTSPFKTMASDNPMMTSCQVFFKTMFGGEIPTKR